MLNEYAVCFANQNGGTLVLGVDDRVNPTSALILQKLQKLPCFF
jgi:predicted HTH transcriptional regulator